MPGENRDTSGSRLTEILSRIPVERIVGTGGIAVLSAASILALAQIPQGAPPAALLIPLVAQLGLNVLADVLRGFYDGLRARPAGDELEFVERLAHSLDERIDREPALRRDLAGLLDKTDSVRVLSQALEGRPQALGRVLLLVLEEVKRFPQEFGLLQRHFDLLHEEHIDILLGLSEVIQGQETAFALLQEIRDRLRAVLAIPLAVPLQRPPRDRFFVGRDAEMKRLLKDLVPGEVVTLCGPGGMGKSALAIQAIWALAPAGEPPERFPDGVVFYSFYGRPAVALACEHIVRSYDEQARDSSEDAVRRLLSRKRALLVLDGAEQADKLPHLLALRGACGALVTSRTTDDAPAGWQSLPPLPTTEAVELLRACGGAYVDDQEAAEQVCQLVGGLPLAVRLIGFHLARDRQPVAHCLEALRASPLKTLDRGKRQLESVPLLLERSVAQLSAEATRALACAGFLALAPFDAALVAAGLALSVPPAEQALGELLSYGLLEEHEGRYRPAHPLIHAYSRERLPAAAEVAKRLAAYLAHLAEAQTAEGSEGFRRLNAERPHLMATLTGCAEREQWEAAVGLVWAVDRYLDLQGHWTERLAALELGLAAARALHRQHDRAAFLTHQGLAYSALGQVERAIDQYQAALDIVREIGDRRGEGADLGNLGSAYHALGQVERAIENHQAALAIAREIGDRGAEGNHLGNLGTAYRELGQVEQAVELYQAALAISRQIGDKRATGAVLGELGLAYHAVGQAQRAIEFHQAALAISREIGDRCGEGSDLGNLGNAYLALGQAERAIEFHQQALAIAREIGDRRGEAADLGNLGLAYRGLGQAERAVEFQSQALAISGEIGDRRGEGNHLANLGLAYSDLGQAERAIEHFEAALEVAREVGDRRGEGSRMANEGIAYHDLGQVEKAIELYQAALGIAREIGDRGGEANGLGNLGLAYRDLGQVQQAMLHWRAALAILQETGDRRGEASVLGNLGVACHDLGQAERAIEFHQAALYIAREIGDRRGEGNRLGNLGSAYHALGQVERAIQFHRAALSIEREVGDRRGEANALGNVGTAYRDLGQVKRAIKHHQGALAIAREIGDRRGEGNHLANLGVACRDLGQVEQARECWEQALSIFQEIKSPNADKVRRLLEGIDDHDRAQD